MPEVPDAQAPSREEQLLSSEANTEIEVQQQPVPTQESPALRSEESPAAPQEAVEAVASAETVEESPYEEGQVYNFVDTQGQGYSIVIQKVEGEELTILNQSVPGAQPAQISLEDAKNMFQTGKLA